MGRRKSAIVTVGVAEMKASGLETRVRERNPDRRMQTLAYILGVEAARWPEIVEFRRNALGGELLPDVAAILPWIQERAAKEGRSIALLLPLSPDTRVEGPKEFVGHSVTLYWWGDVIREDWVRVEPPPTPLDSHGKDVLRENLDAVVFAQPPMLRLYFPHPMAVSHPQENPPALHELIRPDGVLGELKRIAQGLRAAYGWSEAEGVMFVLTGITPRMKPIRTTVHISPSMPRPTKIVMEISPLAKLPDVVQEFRLARRRTFLGLRHRFRETKPVTQEGAWLACLLAETPDLTWRERMERWNDKYPKHTFTDVRNFRRRSVNAYKRVTGREWKAPRE